MCVYIALMNNEQTFTSLGQGLQTFKNEGNKVKNVQNSTGEQIKGGTINPTKHKREESYTNQSLLVDNENE